MSEEFDAFSGSYDELLEQALGVTGFDAEHFARHKLETLRRWLPLPAGAAFLDYGCGPGNLFRTFSTYFPGVTYTGVDPAETMVEAARRAHAGGGEFLSLSDPGWRARTYDLVFAAGVFHHIAHERHDEILGSLAGLLSPTGAIAIWEHNPRNPFTRKIVRDCAFDRDAVLVPPGTLSRSLARAGLAAEIRYVTFFPKALRWLSGIEPYLTRVPLGGQYVALARPSSRRRGE